VVEFKFKARSDQIEMAAAMMLQNNWTRNLQSRAYQHKRR
jgi:hypothetical protein